MRNKNNKSDNNKNNDNTPTRNDNKDKGVNGNNLHNSDSAFDYCEEDIVNALVKLGISRGECVFIHSNIGFFGKLKGARTVEDYYAVFKRAFFKVIGPDGTLVVPVFSYSFCNNQPYDKKKAPSVCGAFSEMVRKDPDALRSDDAIFSVAAIGKYAKYFTENAPEHSFGKDSFWECFLKKNGKICNFNFDSASTFIHYVEKCLNVPYRYDKAFPGKDITNGCEVNKIFYHFVYDYDKPAHEPDFPKFDKRARELGLAKSYDLGKGQIVTITAKETFDLIKQELVGNPEFLIKGYEQTYTFLGSHDIKNFDSAFFGNGMYSLMNRVFPICRSITGNGVRQTLQIIKEHIPLEIHEILSGTVVFDWSVPKEWNINDAYIKNSEGKKIVDFKESNLHVLNYSVPVNKKMGFSELKQHIFTLPTHPEWVPYLTSYYKENWGFCMRHNQFLKIEEDNEGAYEVVIDSSLKDGSLSFGELYIPGRSEEEVLFSTYVCHPSLCNDNLSGPVLLTFLAKLIKKASESCKLRYSYRFLFIPETIGSISWLSLNEDKVKNIKHGLVTTCVGDSGDMTYKKSRIGDAVIDRAVEKVLVDSGCKFSVIDFFPSGSDERQFCSPGFNLPVGSLMRTMYGKFPEYHTSADNLSFVKPCFLADSLEKYLQIVFLLENNKTYLNRYPKCEPQLGKRGLYRMIGSSKDSDLNELAIFWVLNLSDGKNSLLDIAIRAKMKFSLIKSAADALFEKERLMEL